jgi:ureidoglycolate dehydrogenase (NAD+)
MPVIMETRMRRLVAETLAAAGLNETDAGACADASVFADLRGAATHGIVYIVPRTLESIRGGKTVASADIQIVRESGAMALVKGAGVAGPVLGRRAMEIAIDKAKAQGIGFVNTYNGGPIGLLGYYANLAAEAGMLGLVMANTAPAAAPHGGTSAVLGTNPFAYAAPSKTSPPILFDVATTVASAGKLAKAKRRGEAVPEGWLIDAEGRPVTDAAKAGSAVMLPCGGHKGSGFGILIHLLTGALSGTTIGGDPTHNHPDTEKRGQAAVFMAVDPEWFGSAAVFGDMVERQIGFVHGARPEPGRPAPLYPGERGWVELAARSRDGIPVADEDWALVTRAMREADLPVERLLDGIA